MSTCRKVARQSVSVVAAANVRRQARMAKLKLFHLQVHAGACFGCAGLAGSGPAVWLDRLIPYRVGHISAVLRQVASKEQPSRPAHTQESL